MLNIIVNRRNQMNVKAFLKWSAFQLAFESSIWVVYRWCTHYDGSNTCCIHYDGSNTCCYIMMDRNTFVNAFIDCINYEFRTIFSQRFNTCIQWPEWVLFCFSVYRWLQSVVQLSQIMEMFVPHSQRCGIFKLHETSTDCFSLKSYFVEK